MLSVNALGTLEIHVVAYSAYHCRLVPEIESYGGPGAGPPIISMGPNLCCGIQLQKLINIEESANKR